jgi:hypothetical protein
MVSNNVSKPAKDCYECPANAMCVNYKRTTIYYRKKHYIVVEKYCNGHTCYEIKQTDCCAAQTCFQLFTNILRHTTRKINAANV